MKLCNNNIGILPRKKMPDGTEEDHTEESEQITTVEKENASTLASKFNEPTSRDDLPQPPENANLGTTSCG